MLQKPSDREAGIDCLKNTIFQEIGTTMLKVPPKVRKVLIVVQNILQSPTNMITTDHYYNTLVRELSLDDLNLI